MKSFNFNKIELYNFPKSLTRNDYEEVCQLAVNNLKKNRYVLGAYLLGDNWLPGISDLDIAVVYKASRMGNIGLMPPWLLSEKAKCIFAHRYEAHNQSTFKNLHYLLPRFGKIKYLFGPGFPYLLPEKELSQDENKWLKAIFIFDLLINKLLLLFRYKLKKKIDVRELILFVSSSVYTVKLIEEITNSELKTGFYLKSSQLRSEWFKRNRQENIKSLFDLLEDAEELSLRIIRELDKFLRKEIPDFIREIEDKKFFLRNPRYDLTFSPDWQENIFPKEFEKGMIKFNFPFWGRREDLDSYRLVLPNSLFFFLLAYLKEKGPLSDWLRKGMKTNYSWLLDKIFPNKGLYEHIRAVNDYVAESIKFNNKSFKLWLHFGSFPYKRSTKRRVIDLTILFLKKIK